MSEYGGGSAAPPERPGWYADAHGAWWWWDGATWTPAPTGAPATAPTSSTAPTSVEVARSQERTLAMVMWIVFLVGGGWVAALIFYLVSKPKAFVRHHAAEALNVTLVTLVPQVVAVALMAPGYIGYIRDTIDDSTSDASLGGLFWVGAALLVVLTLLTYVVGIAGAFMCHRGRWWRIPLPFHPVRGVVRTGEEPYSVL